MSRGNSYSRVARPSFRLARRGGFVLGNTAFLAVALAIAAATFWPIHASESLVVAVAVALVAGVATQPSGTPPGVGG